MKDTIDQRTVNHCILMPH